MMMTNLTIPPHNDVQLHKAAQRLRWFLAAYEHQIHTTEEETGNRYRTDEKKLTRVFADWLKDFEAQKPEDPRDNTAYVGFAAGLMLRALLRHQPSVSEGLPNQADMSNPAHFWPEGYLYVAFCLNVRGLVLQSDYHEEQNLSDLMTEIRTWWSFRENAQEDPSRAIGFLDLFAGDEPEWAFPQIFRVKLARSGKGRSPKPIGPGKSGAAPSQVPDDGGH
ncbi:hypothetical protein JQU17_10705 [Ponticoccus sp. SC2-23]|nr:hypothetical protein [Ponticoccus sp. SC6-9]MBM1230352.1 hypothetical protein [Ponticoccus sp. SC6-38]MBM1239373.1 hypothetical protein [Ponticoccus sp. SC6-49]MBM1243155.1 hypothetical protein [Ponticoccus sp. SC2-64]MBM1248399.1 hypothetical protein [Ponticoccus sp. SC6-42]MBM1252984.1 hypothetical protein [Ponticoccus sp. SC6-33]MBM1257382.1 hypothetical protein [Ponticoccus sp. SC6-60]MBM1261878.1 hypothetical protein [Ponticoccus sp. SC6-31]MBM1266514.1 hypothetical protein [Pontico